MVPARRALLSCMLSAVLAGRTRAQTAPLRLEPAGDGMAALTGSGIRRPLLLPGAGARLLPAQPCCGEQIALAAFIVAEAGVALEWAALALPQDGQVALLALEPLSWRGADGARMSTRIVATGDRSRLQCHRDSAVPQGPTLWRREAWTDYLAWAPPCGLADAPVRVPLEGTRQHAVAAWRRRAAALVAACPAALSPGLLAEAGLQTAGFSLSVSATPSMRQPSGPRIIV